MTSIDIDHLKSWIGKTQRKTDDLSPFTAQALATALDHDTLPQKGDNLPHFWDWVYFLDTPRASATASDGHPKKGGFLPPVPLPRRMWAAGDVELIQPLKIGQQAQRESTIKAVDLKTGSTGSLIFVTVEHETSQNLELCIRQTQTIVYREQPAPGAPLPPGKSPILEPNFSVEFLVDPVLLFRYSALTYNGHRIHYDRNYAIEEEGYPALVVHGPLLVTLLMNAVTQRYPEIKLQNFNFRALQPTFDIYPVKLQGRREGNKLSLWSVNQENTLCMQITAELSHD